MKLKKRFINFLLALLLVFPVFSGTVFAEANTRIEQVEKVFQYDNENENTNILDNENNEEVRIIVELESKSLLEEAISLGKKFQDLTESYKDDKKAKLKEEQEEFIKSLKDKRIDTNLGKMINYDTALNGIGVTVKRKDIELIEDSSNVRNVYYSQEFERPLLQSQQDIIGANHAWNTLDYKGEGTLVAVIDSGIDISHDALVLDDSNRVKYTKEAMQEAIYENGLKGKYFTEKVPYGYNYYDFSHNLKDSYGNMHGMHVAGIVGSNSKDTNTFGVAPNTQILALKVFSDDLQYPTTFTDVWLKALDDAIKLKADVVNLSLGSAAGFSVEGDKAHPEIEIFKKARKAGVVISVAVGNEANINFGATFGSEARAENYDTGLIANPAVNEDSFAVASMENIRKHVYAISWNLAGEENTEDINLFIPSHIDSDIIAKVIDLKEGKEFDSIDNTESLENEDLGSLPDVEDKIVLIQWPDSTERKDIFEDTLNNIAIRKPKAILLARPDSKISGRLILEGEASKIVYGIIKNSTYRKLATLPLWDRVRNVDNRLTIHVTQKLIDNPLAGRVSQFSTWGPTPDLRIKPEITGVGGNVYSTIENNSYRNMSGTSMASPQVSGASLILKQYLDEKNIGGNNKSELIKTILMNTAVPLKYPNTDESTPYFVRQQGSGALNLEKALKTKAYFEIKGTNDENYDGKLELKQISDLKFDANLKITNFSSQDLVYTPQIIGVKEKIENGLRKQIPISLQGKIIGPKEILIGANDTKIINLSFDFSNNQMEEDNFIEGYIVLKNKSDETTDLSAPFLGFYGDWGNQKAIDAFALPEYGKEERNAQFEVNPATKAYSSRFVSSFMNNLPIINNTLFFSPDSEYLPTAGIVIAPLRNMEEIEYSIIDKDTNKNLRVIGKSINVRKLSRLNYRNSFRTMPESFWDGMINGKPAKPEHTYIYQIKVKLNNGGYGNQEQIYQYPIMIDNQKPFVNKDEIYLNKIEGRLQKINLKVEDKGTGVKDLYLQTMNFKNQAIDPIDPPFDNTPPGTNEPSNSLLPPGSHQNNMTDTNDNLQFSEIGKDESERVKATIVQDQGKAEYGRFVSLHFTDEKPKEGNYSSIIDGKLSVSENEYDFNKYDVRIPVYTNGYKGEIEIDVPILADKTHIEIATKDHISNRESIRIETGFKNSFHAINFTSFNYSILNKNMKLFIDDTQINSTMLPFFTDKEEANIRIEYDGEKSHLSDLIVRDGKNRETIIRGSVVQDQVAEKYNFKYNNKDKYIEFVIRNIKSGMEVITTAKDGPMPYDGDNEDILLDFSEVELDRFKRFSISRIPFNKEQLKEGINLKSGQKLIEMVYSDDIDKEKDTKISSIVIIEGDKEIILKKGQYFDISGGLQGYSTSTYSININYNFTKDTKIIINFEDSETHDSLTDKLDHDHDDHHENDVDDETHKPYPAIYVSTPSLLSVLNEFNTDNNKIRLNGFVGYVNKDDSIKSMEIYLVDKNGDKISESVKLSNEDFKKDHVHYGNVYSGTGYMFTKELPLLDIFNINIKFDVETNSGIKSSMVRRVLYDRLLPSVEYIIEPRNLDSNMARVRLKSTDDSIDLSLFHEDSLIERVNRSSISFESDLGVEVTKEIDIELNYGQNEITFNAKDITGKVTSKTVYIFRAYEVEIDFDKDIDTTEKEFDEKELIINESEKTEESVTPDNAEESATVEESLNSEKLEESMTVEESLNSEKLEESMTVEELLNSEKLEESDVFDKSEKDDENQRYYIEIETIE